MSGVSFSQACASPRNARRWIQQHAQLPYVDADLLTSSLHAEVSRQLGYDIPWHATATTYPLNQERVWHGTHVRLLVHPVAFTHSFKSWERHQEIVLQHHELEHAKHYYSGLPGFEEAEFLRNGAIDIRAFLIASELLAHANEYSAVLAELRRAPYAADDVLPKYAARFGSLMVPYARALRSVNITPETRRKLDDVIDSVPGARPRQLFGIF